MLLLLLFSSRIEVACFCFAGFTIFGLFSFFAVAFFHASRSSYHGRRRRMMHGQQPSVTRTQHVGRYVCEILKDELAFAAALKYSSENLQQL